MGQVISEAQPEVIVHQLTAIPPSVSMRRLERDFALTNRLRIEGTDNLLSAGRAAGASKASSGISPQMSDIDGFNSANGSAHHQNMSSLAAATTLTMSRSPSTAV